MIKITEPLATFLYLLEVLNPYFQMLSIYRRFSICSHDNLSLGIPNNKTIEHRRLKMLFYFSVVMNLDELNIPSNKLELGRSLMQLMITSYKVQTFCDIYAIAVPCHIEQVLMIRMQLLAKYCYLKMLVKLSLYCGLSVSFLLIEAIEFTLTLNF